jgi:hypothetical protein
MELIDREFTINKIWSIGGDSGWYYGDGSGTYVALLINYTVVWAPDEEEPTDTIYILETLWILEVLYANKEGVNLFCLPK